MARRRTAQDEERAPRRAPPAVALGLLLAAAPAGASEPLSDWLAGLGDAAQALDAGDPAAALTAARRSAGAIPRGPAAARAAAATGLALAAASRGAEAVEPLLAAAARAEPEVAPLLQLALGRALLEAGRPAEALPHLAAAQGVATAAARRARWLEAEALLDAGRVAEAAPRLEALLREAPDDPEALAGRLRLAAAARLLGHDARAVELYRAAALEAPERPEAEEALAALERWRAAGGPAPALGGEDRLARAERLLARGRTAEALREAAAAGAATPPAPAERVALLEAFALLAAGRLAEAEPVAAPLAERAAEPGVRRGAAFVLAKAASRAGRIEEAARLYERVAAREEAVPGLPERRWRDLGDEAGYLAAWLYYDAGRLAEGVARLDAFAKAHPRSRRADDARWFAAWARVRLGDRPGASRALARLERGPLADAALYWEGRLSASPARARALYERSSAAGGEGWYGWMARARLEAMGGSATSASTPARTSTSGPRPLSPALSPDGGEGEKRNATSASTASSPSAPIPAPRPLSPEGSEGEKRNASSTSTASSPSAPIPAPALSPEGREVDRVDDRLRSAAALLALGARGAALAELDDLVRRGPARAMAAPVAELAAFAGDADLPFRVARDLLGASPRTRRWLYPAPLPDRLPALALEAAVDADLVRAVVRRESSFRPDARSAAGAVGLMQLIAPTADRLALVAGLRRPPSPRLAEPDLNAGLGAHYLALLVDRFGDEAVAVAAYNAGPRAAAGWARDRTGQPLDEWVEAIPYKETRAYVKAVLAAREAYRRLGGLAPALDPARPVPAPGDGAGF